MIIDVSKIDLDAIKDEKLKAILICIFTDAFVPAEELPDNIKESRGWWGDFMDVTVNGRLRAYTLGSQLWLKMRQKLRDEDVVEIEQIIKESLNILLDAGIINQLEVTVEKIDDGITFSVKVDRDETLTFEGLSNAI